MTTDFDVVVAGGGMVGAGVAALLGVHRPTAALRVAVLEPQPAPFPGTADPWDLRVSALSRASQRLLELTGAWPRIVARGVGRYERMVVWEGDGGPTERDALHFDAAEAGQPDLGHIAENRAVQAALLERAVDNGATLLRTGIASLDAGAGRPAVVLGDGRRLTAALLVGADGGGSTVRRLAGIGTRGWDYVQEALVAHLEPQQPHRHTAWQRFLATGPVALLPLADGRVSLVWSTSPERARELLALEAGSFADAVTEATAGVLGRLTPCAARASFGLRLLHALDYTRPGIALLGDAAHGMHPLAGQGVNLGFLDCAALVEVIGAALRQGLAPGDGAALRRYARWRKAENLPALLLVDSLQRLFSSGHPLLSRIRRAGLGLIDGTAPLKRAMIERALGLSGEVPRLLTTG